MKVSRLLPAIACLGLTAALFRPAVSFAADAPPPIRLNTIGHLPGLPKAASIAA